MNLGMPEMIFIFLLALIIFGPKKLPEIGRQLGRALTEFRRASNEFKSQLEAEIRDLEVETSRIAPPASSSPLEGTVTHEGPAGHESSAAASATPPAEGSPAPSPTQRYDA